ncbi:hypothetical protein CRG98_013214, partial [Punica granatum]
PLSPSPAIAAITIFTLYYNQHHLYYLPLPTHIHHISSSHFPASRPLLFISSLVFFSSTSHCHPHHLHLHHHHKRATAISIFLLHSFTITIISSAYLHCCSLLLPPTTQSCYSFFPPPPRVTAAIAPASHDLLPELSPSRAQALLPRGAIAASRASFEFTELLPLLLGLPLSSLSSCRCFSGQQWWLE